MASTLDHACTDQPAGDAGRLLPPPLPTEWSASRLTHWSWGMAGTFVVLTALVGTVFFRLVSGPLGIHEGDVTLMARSAAGWVAEVGSTSIVLAAPVVGMVLGTRAIRRGGTWGPWAALAVNAACALVTLYTFVDNVHMAYFPSWWG